MGLNTLDVFIALDRKRILAPCFLHIDGTTTPPIPSPPAVFTLAGTNVAAIAVKLTPRSVRSPYTFDQVRSISFGLQFNNSTYEPGDLSVWIPDTSFIHRLRPDVTNSLLQMYPVSGMGSLNDTISNTVYPSMSGQINVNAQIDSVLYLVKELDSNVAGPTTTNACFCMGEFAVQNWDVQPFVRGMR